MATSGSSAPLLLGGRAAHAAWFAAADAGDAATLARLLDNNAILDVGVRPVDRSGSTALWRAARGGYVDACRYLLSRGARVDAKAFGALGVYLTTPLAEAIER